MKKETTDQLLIVACLVPTFFVGCGSETTRWDETQGRTVDQAAKESSRQRVGESDSTMPTEDLGELPPFNPEGPTTSNGTIDWAPSGTSKSAGAIVEIDINSLSDGEPISGGRFNRFFPPQEGEFDMVAKQEKSGFAQYSLRRSGDEIAQLSVTDLRSNPKAAEKFNSPDSTTAGYPVKRDGSKGSTLLVAGRFQVKVRSPGGQLDENERTKWFTRFDLNGLANLAE